MVGLGIDLWKRSAGGAAAFISPNGLNYLRNDNSKYYEDTACTTPATDDADAVAGWKNDAASPVTATQSTAGNRPELELVDTDFNSKSSLICVNSQSSPTTAKWMDIASYLKTAMSSGLTCFAQVGRPSGQNRENDIFSEANAIVFRLMVNGNAQLKLATQGLASPVMAWPNPDVGVIYGCYDGTYFFIGWNDQEIGVEKPTGSWADISFTNNGTLRIGNYDGTAPYAAMRIGKVMPPISTVLTEAQRRSEAQALGNDMGLPFGGRGQRRIVMPGNSLYDGWAPSGYTSPMPDQLATLLGTANYRVSKLGYAGQTTATVASNMTGAAGAINMGHSKRTKTYTIITPFSSSRTIITQTGSTWSSNEFAGWTLVMTSGTNQGMGALVTSNTTSQITLTSPGLPVTPAAGDTFVLFAPLTQRSHLVAIPYEITNDSFANADADGITAAGGVWDDCPIWQRYRCFCLAMKAYGFRLIGMTCTDRTEAGRDANYDTDEPLYNARILANTDGLFDATYDAYTALGADVAPNFCGTGDPHWSNSGAGVIAAGLQSVIEGLTY